MRRFMVIAALCLTPFGASSAPHILDGSDADLEPGLMSKLNMALIKEGVLDPLSAQYHTLGPGMPDHICGYINLKNGFGAYTGFRAFGYNFVKGSVKFLESKPGDFGWNGARMIFMLSSCGNSLNLPGET
jgi:hypothetical protein